MVFRRNKLCLEEFFRQWFPFHVIILHVVNDDIAEPFLFSAGDVTIKAIYTNAPQISFCVFSVFVRPR